MIGLAETARLPWDRLRFVGTGGRVFAAREDVETIARFFRRQGRLPRGIDFLRCGFAHERPGDPVSWGPKTILDVDWRGLAL